MKKILGFLLPVCIAGGLLYYTYHDEDFSALSASLTEVHVLALLGTFGTTFLAHWFRAIRWNILFEPVGYKPSGLNSFLAVMSGYFTNLIIPRAGEVSRCTVLLTSENIPLQTSIGTVLAERALDMLMLILIALVAFGLEFDTLTNFLMAQKAKFGSTGASDSNLKFILALVLVAGAGGVFLLRKTLLKIPLVVKIFEFAKGLVDGLLSVTKLKQPGLFVVLTVLIWAGYFSTTYVSLRMFDFTFDLGLSASFMLLIIGSFGIIIPVPAAVGGPFQAFITAALVELYFKDPAMSLVSATMMYYSQQFFTVVFGGGCYLISVIKANRKLIKE